MNNYNDKFKIVEDISSGDFIFDVYGRTVDELFSNCALACFTAMTEPRLVEPQISIKFEVAGDSLNELLYNFIAELIYLKDAEKMFFSGFQVDIAADQNCLKAVVAGQRIDYDRHTIKADVKAITYHGLDITEDESGYHTRVILDL